MGLRRRLPRSGAWRSLLRFRRGEDGVAAVEFAFILPVMLTILLGMASVTGGINRDRKLVILTRSMADLTARYTNITTQNLSDIFAAASAIMQPYADGVTDTQMVISSVAVVTTGGATTGVVQWSCSKNVPTGSNINNLAKRAVSSIVPVPSGFSTEKSFIYAEATLPYTPGFGDAIVGTLFLRETSAWAVRGSDYVTLNSLQLNPSGCP